MGGFTLILMPSKNSKSYGADMWLLIIITLQLTPPIHVINADMAETFANEEKCLNRAKNIMDQAYAEGKPVPPQINLGCVPLNGRDV